MADSNLAIKITADTVGLDGRRSPAPHPIALNEYARARLYAEQLRQPVEAFFNRGNVLQELGRSDEALALYNRALALNPALPEIHLNRGNVLRDMNRVEEALASYQRSLALQPDSAAAHFNRARTQLVMGNLSDGWQGFKYRWKLGESCTIDVPGARLWLGRESVRGKTLALIGEWDAGDILQFCRYAEAAAELGARVIVAVPRSLVRLLSSLRGAAQVIALDDPLPHFDYYCPMLSLPLAFNTTLERIPARVPYLAGPSGLREVWRSRLGERRKPRIGLAWAGGFRPQRPETWSVNTRRNIPLAQLAPLHHPGLEFYSLQKGEPAESELAQLSARGWDGPRLIDLTAGLRDFAETAALIEQLDLVVTVDTSVAHLAGALGKPVWILNRFDTCWRWLLDRADSPWYPTARLYRQERPGEWDSVIAHVATDIHRLARYY